LVDLISFAVTLILAVAFVALVTWLRTSGRRGELPPPGEPGDADKWPRW
jgi:hypothetical protein